MSDLKDLLHGAGEAKRQLFASDDFADGYGRSVVSRVKRRRVASATAMGGGTVVAVGAIAMGASHVPWGAFVMGASPASSPSVLCTTAAAAPPTASADNSLSLLGYPTPSGIVAWAVAIGSQDPPNIVANIALNLDTREVTGSIPDGNSMVLTPDADGIYAVTFADGNLLTFVVTGDELVLKSSSLVSTGAPTVTCVTSSPEPSASPSADPSGSSVPTPTPTGDIGAGDTPFQCGYVFASEESGTDALRVFGAPTTDSAIHRVVEQWYGDQAPTTVVTESGATAYHASLGSAEVTGLSSSLDPASRQSVQASRDYGMPSLGFTFVAVKDGVVVGTVVPQDDGSTPGMLADRDDTAAPEEAFLWDLDALTPCGTTSIDGAQIYAVAGFGQDGDIAYAWKNVSE